MGNIFGRKKKDPVIPPPRSDNAGMLIKLYHSATDPEWREDEALSVLRAYVRPPWFPIDRTITLRSVTWDEGRDFFVSRGNPANGWPKSRTGFAYPPRPDLGHEPQIHLVENSLNKESRIHLALHEYAHLGIWHYLFLDREWDQAKVYADNDSRGYYEVAADRLADFLLGKSIPGNWRDLFQKAEARLLIEGQKALRG